LGFHLKAERKWSKTIHTYVEAAEYLIPGRIADWADARARHVNVNLRTHMKFHSRFAGSRGG